MRRVVMTAALTAALGLCWPGTEARTGRIDSLPWQDPQPPQSQSEISVLLNNPGSHPRVGFQAFDVAGTAEAREAAATIVSVLADDLEFEREFYVISRKASAGVPAAATPQTLPFAQWTQLGADFVFMGTVRPSGEAVEVEVRLVHMKGATAGKVVFGRTYSGCTLANPRFCAHSIADDLHREYRTLTGVARTRIAFISDRDAQRATGRPLPDGGPAKEVYVMDYDGARPARITRHRSLSIAPAWGPDGRTLAFVSYTSNYPDIYLTLLDGRPATRPAKGTESIHNYTPAISPDGTKIAFMSSRAGQTGNYDIWVVNRDGTDRRNLTPGTPRSSEGAPTWSPNGAQLAFTSDRTGVNQIYVMNADGTNQFRIQVAGKCDRPTWSQLNYIAYALERPGSMEIAVTDMSRMDSRILTDGIGRNEQPTVAPNGRHIAFVTTRWGGKSQIATIDYPDGRFLRQITTSGNNTYPNWSPSPGGR